MTLSSLIRKRRTGDIATAIPAISATQREEDRRTVARIATIAVANPKEGQTIRQPSAPLSAEAETAVRDWLALIEETDPAIIAEVIGQCERDAEALDYFTGRAAAELPKPEPFPDDRRTCSQCRNLRQRVCAIAKPEHGALVVANQGYRPAPARLWRCVGYAPLASDSDKRSGVQRWPGRIQKSGK